MNNGGQASRGAIHGAVGQLAKILLQVVSLVIMSRLLTPTDFGIFAMAYVFIGIGELVRDAGLSSASLQAETLSTQAQSNLFWLNCCAGLILCCLTMAMSPLIASFYSRPDLISVVSTLGAIVMINSLSAQHKIVLLRRLDYKSLQTIEVTSQLLGVLIGLVLAVSGFGFWALVSQQVSQSALTFFFLLWKTKWIPTRYDKDVTVKPYVKYGLGVLGTQIVAYCAKSVDSLLIGYGAGAASLGYYNRANQLLFVPVSQLSAPAKNLATSLLSSCRCDSRYMQLLSKGQVIFAAPLVAALSFFIVVSPCVIPIVMGKQWAGAVSIFQILSFALCVQILGYPFYWTYLSKGWTGQHFRQTLAVAPVTSILMLTGLTLHGVEGVAAGFVVGSVLDFGVSCFLLDRRGINTSLIMSNAVKIALSWLCPSVVALFIAEWSMPDSELRLVIALSVYLASVLAINAMISRVRLTNMVFVGWAVGVLKKQIRRE